MLPFLLHVTNVVTCTPLKVHVGPKGKMLSAPLLCSSFIACISSSNTFIASPQISCPSLDNAFYPVTSVTFNLDAAMTMAHMVRYTFAAVKPRTMKWLSLNEFQTCARISFATINFFPPAIPSPFCEIFSATSST
jgi:hypothetical protein